MTYSRETMSRADEALRLAERIAVKRAEITAMEAEFRRMIGEAGPEAITPTSSIRRGIPVSALHEDERPTNGTHPPSSQGTIAERFLAVLASEPKRTFTMAEVITTMPDVDEKSLRGTMGRLARDRKGVKRVGRGRYRHLPPPADAAGAQNYGPALATPALS